MKVYPLYIMKLIKDDYDGTELTYLSLYKLFLTEDLREDYLAYRKQYCLDNGHDWKEESSRYFLEKPIIAITNQAEF